ncbi:Acetylcholinesterase, partial [Gryllus bimaculatus]
APEPADSWMGIRDATKPGNKCLQFDMFSKQLVGDEDCLVLNVFSPCLPKGGKSDKLHPVLVWIHGGGFVGGYSDLYDPEPFMDYGVVVVTINYRVGPLGFLGLNTTGAPGNAGLKDQVQALRWVKDNISTFGGDPENVTVFGESAGGASVHYLVLSPLAKGLFRRAIAQSGSALCPWALSRDPVGRAKRLALAAGCDSSVVEDPAALLEWFLKVPAHLLVGAMEAAKTADERRRGLVFTFVPCVEPHHRGAFLADDPAALLASGDINRVPLVIGLCSHEGILALPGTLLRLGLVPMPSPGGESPATPEAAAKALEAAEAKAMEAVAADLERVLPEDILLGKKNLQRSRQLVETLKDYYLDGKQLTDETLEGFVHFAFIGRNNFTEYLLQGCKVKGASHGDEMGYMFNMPIAPPVENGGQEELTKKRLLTMWTNFAKGGNPTPAQDNVITATWLPYSQHAPNYLQISEDLKADSGILKERVKFWEDLYRKY